MRHHCAAALGLMAALLLAPASQSHAASADPTGYWMKPDAERESKIQVFKCGSKKTNLCAKIAWLKEPNDSKGQPLHDVRNENPSMRGRQIIGLPIFMDLVPSAPATWTGKIYNPEDGHTYSATLTVVSRKQILLKGCKAWLLCGERIWYRTTPPEAIAPAAPPAEGTQQIEASLTPSAPASVAAAPAAAPASSPHNDEAVANASAGAQAKEMQAMTAPEMPGARSPEETAEVVPVSVTEPAAPVAHQMASPVAPPANIDTGGGYGFLAVSADPGTTAPQSGEDVSSMMLMAKPIAAKTAAGSAAQPVAKTTAAAPPMQPAPLPKPKAQPNPPVATAAAKPAATSTAAAKPATTAAVAVKPAAAPAPKPATAPATKPVATAAAKPAPNPAAEGEPANQTDAMPPDGAMVEGDGANAETADATPVEEIPLTRRERRLLRKQQRELEKQDPLLPWLER